MDDKNQFVLVGSTKPKAALNGQQLKTSAETVTEVTSSITADAYNSNTQVVNDITDVITAATSKNDIIINNVTKNEDLGKSQLCL